MKKISFGLLIIGVTIIVLSSLNTSCNKSNSQLGILIDSNVLISQVWYPYMMKISETDSGNVFFSNKDTIVYKDTTIYFSQCFQQSTYKFNHDHILKMINGCDLPPQQTMTSVWNLTSTGGMELPIISDGTFAPVTGIGGLTEIGPSHFVFNSPFNITASFGDSGYILFNKNIFITFRKK